jgi:carbamoyl-phosphate synthase large subunit
MEKIKVLVTSAGVATAINVITALRGSKKYQIHITAVDMNKYSAGLYLADKHHLVPPIKNPNYIQEILNICIKENIFVVYPLFSKEILLFALNSELFKEHNINIMLPKPEIVKLCDNKLEFYKYLDINGFNCPKIYGKEEIQSGAEFPLFIKPIEGSSTKNAYKIDNKTDLEFYIKKFPNSIIQKYIEGTEYTVDCLALNGETITAIPRIRLQVKDGKTMVGKTKRNEQVLNIVRKLIKTLDYKGPSNIQMIVDKNNRIYIIEMNPRMAAGGLPLAIKAGANIPEMIIDYFITQKLEPKYDFSENLVMIRYLTEVFIHEA